jgi:hypothetical protein
MGGRRGRMLKNLKANSKIKVCLPAPSHLSHWLSCSQFVPSRQYNELAKLCKCEKKLFLAAIPRPKFPSKQITYHFLQKSKITANASTPQVRH